MGLEDLYRRQGMLEENRNLATMPEQVETILETILDGEDQKREEEQENARTSIHSRRQSYTSGFGPGRG